MVCYKLYKYDLHMYDIIDMIYMVGHKLAVIKRQDFVAKLFSALNPHFKF